jgi:hypothetical protein
MKINSSYYCIVDENNKPDYRYLFEDAQDARKQIKQIKNSTKGETVLFSKKKKDYFVDGVNKGLLNPYRRLTIKRGCWTGLRIQKLNSLTGIDPKKTFKTIVKSEESKLSYSQHLENEIQISSPSIKIPKIPRFSLPFMNPGFNLKNSFLATKTFAGVTAIICVALITSFTILQKNSAEKIAQQVIKSEKESIQKETEIKVLGEKDEEIAQQFDEELDNFVLEALQNFENVKQEELEGEIQKIVAGYPIEQMVPYIAKQDRTVAAFLVGIAKKESNFGKRVPVLNGKDCLYYWGSRGIRDRMGSGGHTCFDSPEDAVATVAGRLQDLVQADIDTPQEMVIWKCGSSCAGHAPGSVEKWINDVDIYFGELNKNAS